MKTNRGLSLCFAVIVCGAFLLFYRLGDRDLWSSHEARAAQNAQMILDTGDWLLPRLYDGTPELQKPPLYYWLVAGFGRLGGGQVNEWTERLPAALAAFGTALLLLLTFRAHDRPVAGLIAALVLLTSQHFTWIGRTGRIDIPLTFTVTAAVLGLRAANKFGHLAGYLAIAAGILLKGPLGFVLPAGILILAALPSARTGKSSSHYPVIPSSALWGIPLILAMTVPWFIAVHLRTDGEFTRIFFWHHHVERATGGAATLATHPWWFYLARWVVDTLPWSPFLAVAGYAAWRSSWLREDPEARLGIAWMLSVTFLLSLSRFKRADYLLPAYPGLAIVLGCLGERFFSIVFRARSIHTIVYSTVAIAAVVWTVLLHTVVPCMNYERTKRAFAEQIRAVAPAPAQILFFRVEDHLLAWRLGRPQNSFLEWENLDIWASRTGEHFVVMPAECAVDWRQHVSAGELEEICRYSDRTDRVTARDLVFLRIRGSTHSASNR